MRRRRREHLPPQLAERLIGARTRLALPAWKEKARLALSVGGSQRPACASLSTRLQSEAVEVCVLLCANVKHRLWCWHERSARATGFDARLTDFISGAPQPEFVLVAFDA